MTALAYQERALLGRLADTDLGDRLLALYDRAGLVAHLAAKGLAVVSDSGASRVASITDEGRTALGLQPSETGLGVIEAAVAGDPDRFELVLPGVTAVNVTKLTGLPIWAGQDAPAAARARQGIPRPPSELAGEIREAWWDHNRGVAVIDASFSEKVAGLIRRIPATLRLVVESLVGDRERDSVAVTTRVPGGGSLEVRQQLLEAVQAAPYAPGGDKMTMTLNEPDWVRDCRARGGDPAMYGYQPSRSPSQLLRESVNAARHPAPGWRPGGQPRLPKSDGQRVREAFARGDWAEAARVRGGG